MALSGKAYEDCTCPSGMHTKSGRMQQRTYKWTLTLCVTFAIALLNAASASAGTVAITSGFKERTLNQGENFTLHCKATGFYHVTISWLLDGLPLEYETKQDTGSVRFTADNPHDEESRFLIKNSNEPNDEVIADDDVPSNDGEKATINETSTQAVVAVEKRSDPDGESPSEDVYSNLSPVLPRNAILSKTNAVSVTSELTISKASVQDGGIYTCVARDVLSESISWRAKISVLGEVSIRQNPPIFALIDSVVIVPCTLLGTDKRFKVRWFRKKFPRPGMGGEDQQWTPLPNDHRQTVHENGSFEIRDARKNNEGIYRCEVDMVQRIDNMSTPLKVMVPPKIKSFNLAPVRVGETVGAFCIVTEGDLPLDIYWRKNGKVLKQEDAEMHPSGKRALSLAINSADLTSAGNYSCCAQNNVSRTCVVSTLTVLDAPRIHDLPPSLAVISGTHVSIPCHATGFPKPNVTWMRVKDDDSSNEYQKVATLQAGHTTTNKSVKIGQFPNGTLFFANISSSESGKYVCRAVNRVDELSRFINLRVDNPARILDLAGTDDVIYGSAATMQCASWGDDFVDIRWYFNDMLLSPSVKYFMSEKVDEKRMVNSRHAVTLNKLSIKNSSRIDTGRYSCKVGNKFGSATRHINIVVRAPPSPPSKLELAHKDTSFLRVLVTPGPDDGGSKLLAYVLTYYQIPFQQPADTVNGGHGSATKSRSRREASVISYPATATGEAQELVLDNLECGRQYDLKVRTENEIGLSFGEAALLVSTIGSVPIIPAVNELVVDVNQTAAVLDLRAWQNGGCPITAMTIEYARHGDTEWNVTRVSDEVLGMAMSPEPADDVDGVKDPGTVILSDLQVGTWYKIWTSACNNAGCNYVTHSVATLQKDGATVPPLVTEMEKKTIHTTDARFLVPMVCGFSLVLLLVVLLLFYRYKQRFKKQRRLRAAKKMANSLLYKTDEDQYSPQRGAAEEGGNGDQRPGPSAGRTNASSLETSPKTEIACIDLNASAESHLEYVEPRRQSIDPATETLLQNVRLSSGSHDEHSHVRSNCSKSNSTASSAEVKQSLTDKEEFAVFRDDTCSDDESAVMSTIACDESAFSDAGTWSYFHPNSKNLAKKYSPPVRRDQGEPSKRKSSSSSSGTDEELAAVFGLSTSKKKTNFIPKSKPENFSNNPGSESSKTNKDRKARNSDPNYKDELSHTPQERPNKSEPKYRPSPRIKVDRHKENPRDDQYYTVGGVHNRSGLPNPVGILYPPGPRTYQHMPDNTLQDTRRAIAAPKPRHGSAGQNPFRPTPHLAQQVLPNLQRFVAAQQQPQRGHTFSSYPHAVSNALPSYTPLGYDERQNPPQKPSNSGRAIGKSSPFGERQWVDSYDSQYGSVRSKRPSWGSTDLDKEAFYTPPSSNVSGNNRDKSPRNIAQTNETLRSNDVIRRDDVDSNGTDIGNRKARRLESSSPRDSGIGTDDTPSSMQLRTTPPSYPAAGRGSASKLRRIRNSVESPTDSYQSSPMERSKHDSGIRESKSEELLNELDEDAVFPVSPPPTPPDETRLAPHVFVDLSPKCNTSPTRSSRSSYPPSLPVPSRASCNNAGPARIGDFMPTPPQSGPTSPADQTPSHARQFRPKSFEHDGWPMANLDNLGKYKDTNSDPYLTRAGRGAKGTENDICDTTYAVLNEDNTWLASTLV